MMNLLLLFVTIDPFLILKKTPKLKEVYKLLKDKSSRWDNIGRELDVPMNDREALHKDSSLTNNQRLEFVLDLWL